MLYTADISNVTAFEIKSSQHVGNQVIHIIWMNIEKGVEFIL